MVLDEDALEAMLKRQNAGKREPSEPVQLTDETDEFAVYERPKPKVEPSASPPPPPAPSTPALEQPEMETPGPIPEPFVPEPEPRPTAGPEITQLDPSPTPADWSQRTHAPEPPRESEPAHNFAPPPAPSPAGTGPRIAIVQALFNQELTDMMAELAKATTTKLGGTVTAHVTVPGVYDLPLITRELLRQPDVDGAVVLGVVVQGETKHDELITHATAQTLQQITLDEGKPIGLGITGPGMTWAQAEARVANGAHAVEAVVAQIRVLTPA